jgi:hypothetical protein
VRARLHRDQFGTRRFVEETTRLGFPARPPGRSSVRCVVAAVGDRPRWLRQEDASVPVGNYAEFTGDMI